MAINSRIVVNPGVPFESEIADLVINIVCVENSGIEIKTCILLLDPAIARYSGTPLSSLVFRISE